MFPSCYSKPADGGARRSSVAKLLLGVFMVYMLHTVWLLYGFLNAKPCDGGSGEHCITSYLAARPRLQVSTGHCSSLYSCLDLLHGLCIMLLSGRPKAQNKA